MMDAPLPEGLVSCWQDFLSKDRTLDDLFASPLCFPLQRQREMRAMLAEARTISPRVIMEIGADKGGGIWAWAHEIPTVQAVIACEIRGCPYQADMAKAFPSVNFAWMERSSLPPPDLLSACKVDVLFIDGSKSNMYADFKAYLPLMNTPGIVFFHDVQEERSPMKKACELASIGRRHRIILDKRDAWDAMEREALGIPPANAHEGWLRHWRGKSCGVGVVYLEQAQ